MVEPMDTTTALTVGEVAALTKVSVRTLHHYDEIGLLRPTGRSDAGYRLYDDAAVARLHQIVVMRELGLSLEVIRRTIDDADFDTAAALERQLVELSEAIDHLEHVRKSVTSMLTVLRSNQTMDHEIIAEVFDGFDPTQYEDEVEERWGDTAAYVESTRRTKSYTRDDWQRLKNEADAVEAAFADALAAGTPPTDPAAMTIAERHRTHIGDWFYTCSPEMHRGLAEMYVADPRFAEHFNSRSPGLAQYVSDAIKANAARH